MSESDWEYVEIHGNRKRKYMEILKTVLKYLEIHGNTWK
jgi:hypothetical protein